MAGGQSERVFVGVGSNQENRSENIALALLLLERDPAIRVVRCSRAFLTEPVSDRPQPTFLNAVLELRTSYEPGALLARLKEIESSLGRVSAEKWGPRPIDEPGLEVPHPHLAGRHFVLYPLADLAPDCVHPVLGVTVAELRRRLPRTQCPPISVEWGRIPRWSTVSTVTS
jgi:2-amino-4-hydroxy-6-hydroxymethyldihydropteridine diphosphokinase